LGYNSYEPHNSFPGENWVGDLMIDCEVVVDKAQGEVVLELSKSHNRFQLVWDLATGDMELKRLEDEKKEAESLAKKKPLQPKQGSTYRLRFANFDDRLIVWLNDSLPFDEGVTYQGSKEQHAGPVAKNDLEPASIGVKGASVTVRKLSLWRDLYYTAGDSPTSADATGNVDLTDPDTWSSLQSGMPTKILYVQPDHFLCLGDNSPESSDGRSWGLVPERLLLGRAMLVYYPFGRAGRIR
jgi:signal peptidase I